MADNPAQRADDNKKSASGVATSRNKVSVGVRLRRLFQNGGFYGKIDEVGFNDAGCECMLVAYDDGHWETIVTTDIESLESQKVLRVAKSISSSQLSFVDSFPARNAAQRDARSA